jgi:cytochrome c-type biogenesis protein
MMDVSFGIAFLAGLISFLSPCVLPLVPAYISYLGGRMGMTVDAGMDGVAAAHQGMSARFGLFLHGAAFVMGFTLVFVLLGVTTTALVQQLGGQNIRGVTDIISRLGGVLIVFFGLHFGGLLSGMFGRVRRLSTDRAYAALVGALTVLGVVVLVWGFSGRLALWARPSFTPVWPDALALLAASGWIFGLFLGGAFTAPRAFVLAAVGRLDALLYADTRRQFDADSSSGLGGSLMMGVIFSAGWSPCIGAVYGSILTMSANTGNITSAAVLLAAYSLGLGVPFLVAAFALDGVQGVLRRINRRMKTIKLVSGLLLVLVGLLVMSGELARINAYLQTGQYGEWSVRVEECGIAAAQGTLQTSLQECLEG